jgi:diguanylate cyclase (GGDEF)-like protein/PAS domain S-box-containing protein/putative nucleotidyltransferase with HDIG domain
MDHSFDRDIIMRMPVGYALHRIVLDLSGRPNDYEFIEVNTAFERATGLGSAAIVGRKVTEVIPGIINDSFDWIGLYGDVALTGKRLSFEQYSEELGKWYQILAYSPEKNYFVVLLTDVTKEKNEIVKSAENEKKWKRYTEAAPLGIVIVSSSGRILEVNQEACRLSGYEQAALLTTKLRKLMENSSRIIGLMFFKELVSSGEAECQLQLKTRNGVIRWFNINAKSIETDQFILYCQDITSNKDLEEDLIKSELLYRTFINASNDFIYLKDDELRYVIVNDALVERFGTESSEIVGKTDFDFMPEITAEALKKSDQEVINTKSNTVSEDTFGDMVYKAFKFPVSIGDGRIGVGAYMREVTAEKKQEEILKRSMERHRILANALMMSFQSSQDQLDYALREALRLTGSQLGYIFLYDDKRRELKLKTWTEGVPEMCGIPVGQTVFKLERMGIWGEVVREQKPIIVNNFDQPNPFKRGYMDGHISLRNFMSIPVIIGDRIVATVGLANKSAHYDDYDVYELSMLMNGVWVAAEKKDVQKKMENLLEQTQAMFNEHDAVMLVTDPATGKILDANPAAVSFYGYTKDELLSLKIDDISVQPEPDDMEIPIQDYEQKQKYYSFPHRLKSGDIRRVDVYSCPITYYNEKVLFSIIFDVTEREEAFEEIKYLSFHDHLTGLYNRRYFDHILKQLNDEKYMPLAIVMADVNGLKLVNDSFGHIEGDELLKKAAEIITEGCRKEDISARIGGDEFAIILPNTDYYDASKIVRRIKKLQSKIKIKQLSLSLSFGYAVKHSVASDIEIIVSDAENKMYKNKMYESASTRNKTVNIILKTLFEKSDGELEHSNRVSNIASAIASEMGYSTEHVNSIGIAGLLHDIGKIGIDETILNKPGFFNKTEREEIEKHAESGWRILNNSDEYSELADYILYHHEYVDGKGYPRGIKGDSIPLESRIIAVADAYDAMTNDRPYRKGMTKDEAIEEIKKNTGSQFDPEVVSVFLEKVLSKNNDKF